MPETKTDKPDVAVADEKPESQPKPTPSPASEPKGGFWWGTGRRKSSVARVLINKKELSDYFPREQDRQAVIAPLKAVDGEKSFDVFINAKGGGSTGQSGACMLGIARALKKYDENYLQTLRDSGHLTRDSRMVERKKPGQRGARRRFQFSKR